MPYNGSGTYVLPVTSLTPNATADTTIVSNDFDIVTNDIETALTACITAEGDKTASGDLPMGGNIHTGVGDATALDEYASANQVVDNTLTYGTSATGNDTYLVDDMTINPVAYANGNRFQFIPNFENDGACTVDFMSIGQKNIKMANGDDPISGAIQADVPCDVMYDGTSFILMNPFEPYLDTTPGTMVASKALIADASKNFDFDSGTLSNASFDTTAVGITQSAGDNSTSLATTAYIDGAAATYATTTLVSSSLAQDTAESLSLWAHGLGTDDVDFGFSWNGSVDTGEVIAIARGANSYGIHMQGYKVTTNTSQAPATPATGIIACRVVNRDSSAQVISLNVWARVR